MKNYPDRSLGADELRDAPLKLPVAPNFVSRPPQVEFNAMLKRIEENLRWHNTRPGAEERRLAEKIRVEFVL